MNTRLALRACLAFVALLAAAPQAHATTLTINATAAVSFTVGGGIGSLSLTQDGSEVENGGFVTTRPTFLSVINNVVTLQSTATGTASSDGSGSALGFNQIQFGGNGTASFFVNTFAVSSAFLGGSLTGAQPGDSASASGNLEFIYSLTTAGATPQTLSGSLFLGQFTATNSGINLSVPLPASFIIPGVTSGAEIPYSNLSIDFRATIAGSLDVADTVPVPEPASITMLAVGLAGLTRSRLRRRH